MRAGLLLAAATAAAAARLGGRDWTGVTSTGTPFAAEEVVYGPYWSRDPDGSQSREGNTYYLWRPTSKASSPVPTLIQIHGGGFTGGSATRTLTAEIEGYLDNGIAYVSVDYRLVTTKYFKGSEGSPEEEEFIHASADGSLALDESGKPMSSYAVRVGRQEFNTKCSFDAAAALEDLVSRAGALGLDMHRVGFTGSSAGGGEINYLAWVYHRLHPGRFTPVSMAYDMAQLAYPVENTLDTVYGLWADDVGSDTSLSSLIVQDACPTVVGNPWCLPGAQSETDVCNRSWHESAMERFCAAGAFGKATLGQLREEQVWDASRDEQAAGIKALWDNPANMALHTPKPFFLYVFNHLNSSAAMSFVHNSLYARQYFKVAKQAGINVTAYWSDYTGMKEADKGLRRFRVPPGLELNYESTFDFLALPGVLAQTARTSWQEQMLFHCHAFGVACNATAPAPPLSPQCQDEVKKDCGAFAPQECMPCVHAHAQDLMDHGCPRGAGAAEQVIQYCQTL